MKPTATLAAAVTCMVLLVTSCGAAADKVSEKVSEKAAEKVIEDQTGGKVEIDTDGDGAVEIETEQGTASFGTGETPEEWPESLDLPGDLEIQSGTTFEGSDGRTVAVVGMTAETPEALLARYKKALATWDISGESTSTSGGTTLAGAQWDNGAARVTLAASAATADGATFLTISHTTLG